MTLKTYPEELNGVHFSIGNNGGSIPEAAWCRFCDCMEGKDYGFKFTRDAWVWFLSGWQAHITGPRNDRIEN